MDEALDLFEGHDILDNNASFESVDDALLDREGEELAADLEANLEAIPEFEDDEEEEVATPVRKRASKFKGPYLKDIYKGMQQGEMASESTETKMRGMWGYWKSYCESINRNTAVLESLGLNLYNKRGITPAELRDSKQYDRGVTDGFFVYLVNSNVGKSVLTSAKTFLNINLKCEHYQRQKLGEVEYPDLVEVKVGESIRIRKQMEHANSLAAGRSLERCDDLQAELDEYISPEKNREMLLFVFKPKPGGEVQKLNPAYRFIFGCAKNLLDSTLRRSEELKPQRLVQRSNRSVRQIGPILAFLVAAGR